MKYLYVALRSIGLAGSAAAAFYYLGHIRTWEFGPSLRHCLAILVFLVPFLLVALLSLAGLGRRRLVRGLVLWVAVTLGAVEGFAQAQEVAFRLRYQGGRERGFEHRWWPFHGNVIHYDPERGFWGDC